MSTLSKPSEPDAGVQLDVSHVMHSGGDLALRASRCTACGQATFPASTVCPFCLADSPQDLPLAGLATLYSFTRVHTAPKSWKTPYAVGYADFPNGLRLLAKLADAVSDWRADQPVELKIVPADEQRYRYYLERVSS